MKRFLRDNGLSVAFGLLFLATLLGQAIAGHADYNHRQVLGGGQTITFWHFLATSDFAVDVAENWQSEYLQFFLYIFATVWLVQRGSPESKEPDEIGFESAEKQRVGAPRRSRLAEMGACRWVAYCAVLPIAGHCHGRSVPVVVAGAIDRGAQRVQRGAAQRPRRPADLVPVHRQRRLLEPNPAELAIRVPRHRVDGGTECLPTTARLTRVQTGWHTAQRH